LASAGRDLSSHAAAERAVQPKPFSALSASGGEYDFARHLTPIHSAKHSSDEDYDPVIQFRLPEEGDRPIIEQWIALDPEHSANKMTSDFFFVDTTMSLVIGDDRGPGIFVRVDPEAPDSVRLHIQFGNNEVRSMKMLLRAWVPFKQGVWNSGVRRMVFESHSKLLIGFCKRVFGFERVPGKDHDYELTHLCAERALPNKS
jgi:hypothetical protein